MSYPLRPGIGLRYRILQRDAFTCRYCGRSAPDVRLEVDHILPVARGGDARLSNLVTACYDCNMGKSAHDATEPLTSSELLRMLTDDAEMAWDLAQRERRDRRELEDALDAAHRKIDHLVDVIETLEGGYRSRPTHIVEILGGRAN